MPRKCKEKSSDRIVACFFCEKEDKRRNFLALKRGKQVVYACPHHHGVKKERTNGGKS